MPGLDTDVILNQVISHAMASGFFDRVNTHEPKNAPGNGLTCAVWANRIRAAKSGLDITSALLVVNVRIYSNMLQEPQDAIDPHVIEATDALFNAYIGDFTLGGNIRHVDVRGVEGVALEALAGYITIGNTMYRCMTITLPLVINDVWTEAP
jgi:hypothetical protein